MNESIDWEVAVYLAGGDGLNAGMIRSLQDLQGVADSSRGVGVMAQFEPRARRPRLFAFTGAERLPKTFTRANDVAAAPQGLARFEYLSGRKSGEDPSSRDALSEFVRLGIARGRESRNFMLVLSGHGNGAVGELFGYRGLERALSSRELAPALAAGGAGLDCRIDVLGMDCCNMSMIEVGFELAPYARWLVASESVLPAYGWPYRQVLEKMAMHGDDTRVAAGVAAEEIVDFYADYALTGVSAHCATTDLDRIEWLAAPMSRLSETLRNRMPEPAIWRSVVLAHWEAQSFKNEEYVDLGDFCARLCLHLDEGDIQRACIDVLSALGRVVRASHVTGAGFQYSTGLSIYFPWSNDRVKAKGELGKSSALDEYRSLAFSRQTLWGEFLDVYLEVTRRDAPSPSAARASTGSPATALAELCVSALEPVSLGAQLASVDVRRAPPVGRGGEVESAVVKNHPCGPESVGSTDDSVGVRRAPPVGRGGEVESAVVKNHPCGLESVGSTDDGVGVRRAPPVGRGGEGAGSIKNHPGG